MLPTLTTGVDTLNGTAGDDMFVGVAGTGATSSALDTVAGGAGIDTFKLSTDGAIVLPGTFTSIEKFHLIDTVHQSLDISTGAYKSAGVTDLILQGGVTVDATTLTVTGGAGQSKLTLKEINVAAAGGTVADGGFAWTTLATSETATGISELTLNVDGVGAALTANAIAVGITTADVKTLNVVSTNTNFLNLENAGAGLTTLKLSGAGDLTTYTALTAGIKTIDASTATGKTTIDHATNAAVINYKGGSAADTLILGGTFIGMENTTAANRDVIDGGAGRDTLVITSAIAADTAATSVAQTNVTNVEIIKISDASAANVNLTRFASADTLSFGNATVGAHTYTFNSGSTAEFLTGAAGNNARTFAVAGTGTSDSLTIKGVAATDLGNAAQTFQGVETLNIYTGAAAGTAMIFGGTLVMAPTAGTTTAKVVATGNNALTLTGVVTATEIDASKLEGILTVSAAPANAITIKGGTKADVITGSAQGDAITGGNGADVITGGAGSDIIDLTETTAAIDKVVFSGGAVGNDVSASLLVTANGVDIIKGFGVEDLINVAALGDGSTGTALTAITTAGAQAALTTDRSIVVSANGTAGNLTTSGTKTITDWTSATEVAAYLTERFTVTADAQHNVIILNNTAGSNDTSYVWTLSNVGTDTTIDAADIFLVGTITHTAGTALTNANVVFA